LWPTHLFFSSAKAYPNHDEIVIQFTLITLQKVETNCTKNGFRDSKLPSVKILTSKKKLITCVLLTMPYGLLVRFWNDFPH
jgi:hypothetical protein